MDLLVMENCFYDRPVWRIYDLKGSERNRFNEQAHSRPDDSLEVGAERGRSALHRAIPALVIPSSSMPSSRVPTPQRSPARVGRRCPTYARGWK